MAKTKKRPEIDDHDEAASTSRSEVRAPMHSKKERDRMMEKKKKSGKPIPPKKEKKK